MAFVIAALIAIATALWGVYLALIIEAFLFMVLFLVLITAYVASGFLIECAVGITQREEGPARWKSWGLKFVAPIATTYVF